MRIWATFLTAAILFTAACNSKSESKSPTTGGSGGQSQGAAGGQGGAGGIGGAGASGGSLAGRNGQGGQAGRSPEGGVPVGSGGRSGQGGATTDPRTDAGVGGAAGLGGQGGGVEPSAGNDGGAKDLAAPDANLVGNPRRVLLCDEGNRRVLLVDLDAGKALWSTQLNDPNKYGDGLRDIQLVGGDRVAASTAKGYVELDIKTGEVKKEVSKFSGVESLRRLPNGNTILGSNSDGGVTLQELNGQDAPVAGHKVTFTNYSQLRLFRRTPQNTFLIAIGAKLAEVTWAKQTVWEMNVPGGDWVFQGLRLPDGTIAVTSGYGSAILVVDQTTKKVLTTIGGKSQPDAARLAPNFYAGFQVLSNGHFVVTNWEGHGGGNGGKGIQLLEYDTKGALVWSWKQDPQMVSSLHGVIVLDGLDTTKLHDDVNGVLAPVTE